MCFSNAHNFKPAGPQKFSCLPSGINARDRTAGLRFGLVFQEIFDGPFRVEHDAQFAVIAKAGSHVLKDGAWVGCVMQNSERVGQIKSFIADSRWQRIFCIGTEECCVFITFVGNSIERERNTLRRQINGIDVKHARPAELQRVGSDSAADFQHALISPAGIAADTGPGSKLSEYRNMRLD